VAIRGRGTVLFRCRNGEHRALTNVYWIPQLKTSIISLEQLDERGAEVVIKGGVLRICDQERRLLAKVTKSKNRLFLLDLKVKQPVCLAAQCTEEPWLWHGRFGHLNFDALSRLAAMVKGMPKIQHASELSDSCLVGKQRRLPFPKEARYRAREKLELVHGDLCGPITPATHGGRRYFLLLVDDCSCYVAAASGKQGRGSRRHQALQGEGGSGVWEETEGVADGPWWRVHGGGVRHLLRGGGGGTPSHGALLTAAEWRGGTLESVHRRDGKMHAEGQGVASGVLG